MDLADILRKRYPWLVANWNGADYEATVSELRRRMRALEAHMQDQSGRINDLEYQLNSHGQGQQHRPRKPRLPEADAG